MYLSIFGGGRGGVCVVRVKKRAKLKPFCHRKMSYSAGTAAQSPLQRLRGIKRARLLVIPTYHLNVNESKKA
jgi:hypothetical protein